MNTTTTNLPSRKERIAAEEAAKRSQKNKKIVAATTLAVGITTSTLFANVTPASACDCAREYTVQKGDTLYSLAKKYHVTVEQLKMKNGLESDVLKVGQKMDVPFLNPDGSMPKVGPEAEEQQKPQQPTQPQKPVENKPAVKPPVETPKQEVETSGLPATVKVSGSLNIRSGAGTGNSVVGSLRNGAQVFVFEEKAGWTRIQAGKVKGWVSSAFLVTGHDSNVSKNSETVKEPSKEVQKPTVSKPVAPQGNTGGNTTKHTVVRGDNLWKISRQYGTTVERLMKDNKLSSTLIFPGKVLVVNTSKAPEAIGQFLSAKGKVVGAGDNTTVYVNINGVETAFQTGYGEAPKYARNYEGKVVTVTYTKVAGQNAKLVSMK